ncbi:MAG TPA: hypothetical protein VK206_08745 [Anaerolineales bacterium]|nr:hypothetical protein [Anaerolineales bacterium]HLO29357.1 hypothetical protein [Anaerolineales bacterium]
MEANGFTTVATTIALKELLQKGFVSQTLKERDINYSVTAYTFTDEGWKWILNNKDKFALEQPPKPKLQPRADDDIPF